MAAKYKTLKRANTSMAVCVSSGDEESDSTDMLKTKAAPARSNRKELEDQLLEGVEAKHADKQDELLMYLKKLDRKTDELFFKTDDTSAILSQMPTKIKKIDRTTEKINKLMLKIDDEVVRAEINHLSLKCQVNAIARNQQTSDIMGIVLSIILGIILIINLEPSGHVQKRLFWATTGIFVLMFLAVVIIDLGWPAKIYEHVAWRTVRASYMHIQVVVATFAGFWTKEREFGILLLGVAVCETLLQLMSRCIIRLSNCECCCCLKIQTEIKDVFGSVKAKDKPLILFTKFLSGAAGLAFLTELCEPTVEDLTQLLEDARLKFIAEHSDKDDDLNQLSAEDKAKWTEFLGTETWNVKKTIAVMKFAFNFIMTGKKEEKC